MARDMGCPMADLMKDDSLRENIDLTRYVTDSVGMPTLSDIMAELAKPGRDPRERFESFRFEEGVEKIEDVKAGMKLPGIVTNITAFGVFVDIGVHQDGLIHISELSDRFIKTPGDVVSVHQKVTVTVLDVDMQRKRISLSMKSGRDKKEAAPKNEDVKAVAKAGIKRDRDDKKTKRFVNNPFYEAFRKK
jgi:uncharacterized protein